MAGMTHYVPSMSSYLTPSRMALAVLTVLVSGCASTPWQGTDRDPARLTFSQELGVDLGSMDQMEPGLYVQDIEEGDGPAASRSSRVRVHYLVWLPDGTLVDGSVGQEPYLFRLGGDEVILGWNRAIPGMRVGGIRRLVVRPGLAYGSRRAGNVPSNSTLVFEIQLMDVG